MSEDRGRDDRPHLEDLVQRARTGLRDWTDTTDHDPGVALLELFAYVAELLTDLARWGAEDQVYVVSRREDGATVIEFGDGVHGERPPSGSSIGVRYRHGGGYSGVLLQQGRVVIEADETEEPSLATCGVFRATVLDNADPLIQRRLFVRVPDLNGDEGLWAAACLTPGGTNEVPASGAGVWVALESGDPSRPIWLGQRITD